MFLRASSTLVRPVIGGSSSSRERQAKSPKASESAAASASSKPSWMQQNGANKQKFRSWTYLLSIIIPSSEAMHGGYTCARHGYGTSHAVFPRTPSGLPSGRRPTFVTPRARGRLPLIPVPEQCGRARSVQIHARGPGTLRAPGRGPQEPRCGHTSTRTRPRRLRWLHTHHDLCSTPVLSSPPRCSR
jgi:hypothetical protein